MYNKPIQKILKHIFSNPNYRFHVRELARISKLNPNTVTNASKLLLNEGIIRKEEKKHLVEIYFDFESKKAVYKKRIFNLNSIYDSGLIDVLIEKYNPNSISLIGSYSRGEDTEKSDIDIALITNKKEHIRLDDFEKKLGKKIHLLLIEKNKISNEFFNNLINGIVFYGAIEK